MAFTRVTITFILFLIARPAVAQELKVKEILQKVSVEVDRGDYSSAAKLLQSIDVHKMEMPQDKNSGEFRYLAVGSFGVIVPGISDKRARRAIAEKRYIMIAGTSDYAKSEAKQSFHEAAIGFASEYNMFVRYFGTKELIEEGEVELSVVSRELSLSADEWARIPLRAQLRIRNFVEHAVKQETREGKLSTEK